METPFTLIGVLLCVATITVSQTPKAKSADEPKCDASYKSLPALQGIKLNMQPTDLGKSWHNLRELGRDTEAETIRLALEPKADQPHGELGSAEVELFDNKVWKFTLDYRTQAAWDDALQFGRNLGRSLNLPDAWSFNSVLPSRSGLECRDFSIDVFVWDLAFKPGHEPIVTVKRTDLEDAIAQRRKETQRRNRATFKP